MRRLNVGLLAFVLGVAGASLRVATQSAQLGVVDAGPKGEVGQRHEALEIRVVFSEPMVALGRVPSNPTLPWMHIAPAMKGEFRWSGTTALIFTPDPSTPLPNATRYSVTVDAVATSAAGRRLGAPYQFAFTTPTPRLISASWSRESGRFTAPVVLALQFNQRMRAADVLAHLRVRYESHAADVPVLSARARARLAATDPAGLQRFDAKAAAARRTAARTDNVAVRQAADWDKKRFPPADNLIVLETTTAPPPGTWLLLTLDATLPSPEGPERPAGPQTSSVELAPEFFVTRISCEAACDPAAYNAIEFTAPVEASAFAGALSIRQVATPGSEAVVNKTSQVQRSSLDVSQALAAESGGFDPQPPATTWAYRLDSSLQSADGQTLGYPWVGLVENWHQSAFTSFGDGHGVWEKDAGPQLPFSSRNFRGVTQWLSRVTPTELMPLILSLQKRNFLDLPPGEGVPRRLPVTPDLIQAHGFDLSAVLSPQGTGLGWAGITPQDPIERSRPAGARSEGTPEETRSHSTVVQVTNLGISVKDSPQSTLVFVTRLDNAQPVADARVSIVNVENRAIWRGSTGRDGIAMAPALPLREPEDWNDLSFLVIAEKNGDVAYVGSDWNEGIGPWDFGHSFQLWEASSILRGSVFTDRGVYRPGEEIHVKAIVRADTPKGMSLLPAGATLEIRVRDSRDREVDRRTVKVNRWSSVDWTWTVPAGATLGAYAIEAAMPGIRREPGNDLAPPPPPNGDWLKHIQGSFLVAAYRRPDFRVDTALTIDTPVAGATLGASVDAKYLFGNPMAKRPVSWTLKRQPDFSTSTAILDRYPDEQWTFGYYPRLEGDAEARVAGEKGLLDQTGKLAVPLPTAADVDFAYRYTFESDVEDVSRQHLANRSSLVVRSAPWSIGLRRPDYFADTAKGTSVDVIAVDDTGTPVAGIPVTLSLFRVQWNSVRHAEGGGFYAWDSERVEVPAGSWSITSAAAPVTVTVPVPEGGYYELRAIATGAAGHRTRTDTSFYGIGGGYTAWERFDHNRITLQPEKKTWKPGEKARVMVQSPWETATALMTVEREGIRRYERFTVTSTQQTIEVPITEADIPNVFVSVLLVRGRTSKDPGADGGDPGKPAFRLGYTELMVEDAAKRLAVQVSADRAEYRPANVAKVSVAVTDAAGSGARSEVTLWAVDYGILSLTDYQAPDVLRAVYEQKALQVINADSRQRIVSRRVLTPKGANDGGGGGMDPGPGNIRRDFRPLAFWLGSVETDGSGRATKDITLPESLTTYRIMAVAGDARSRFGSAKAEIRVTRPVTLVPAFPRFLGLGDRATFGAVLTNTEQTGGEATVTIRSLDPNVLQFQGTATQTVRLEAASSLPVRFDALARGTGTSRVQMSVKLGANTDAFETTLPVSAVSPLETNAAFGDTDARAVERLAVPSGIVPGLGGLQVSMSSTALVGLGEGARYLADYPYGCAEQKASSALALALAADLGSAFKMTNLAPAGYRQRATELLNTLPGFQCADGGFGYWPGSCLVGNTYLTAYVLHVVKTASGLGIPANDPVVKQALDFLEARVKTDMPRQVQSVPAWAASLAFGVKVLAEYGRNQDANITRLVRVADRMPIFALSYLADAMAAANDRGPRYEDLERRMTNAVRVEGNQAHVQEMESDELAWLWNSNVRSSALVLEGFVRRGQDGSRVQPLVRGLLAGRRNGRWGNTQENAAALQALVAYYKKFETEVPDMAATVALGATPIGSAIFRGRSSTSQDVRVAMPELLRQIPAGVESDLTVSRTGAGRLYYSTRFQFAPIEPLPASDHGVRIERRYERFNEDGGDGGQSPAATTFNAGDLIRVTLAITLLKERRYLAITDALPAGVEAVDSWFRTTASDVARDASVSRSDGDPEAWWKRGGFDHVEKYDNRVQLFATRLADGRHEFSYLVRATTAGTFRVAGASAEEMYAPEVNGRSAPVVFEIR